MFKERSQASVINAALMLHLGMPADFAFDDNSQQAAACNAAYEQTLAEVFALTDWSFSRRTRKLAQIAETPENGYRYGFQMPGDNIGLPTRLLADPRNALSVVRDYTLEADKLYCDFAPVWLRYNCYVKPDFWGDAFADAFTVALAAKLAIACQQNTELAEAKRQEAFGTAQQGGTGGKFGRLMAQDRAAAPVTKTLYLNDPLTNARFY